jgi:hypothetical protein
MDTSDDSDGDGDVPIATLMKEVGDEAAAKARRRRQHRSFSPSHGAQCLRDTLNNIFASDPPRFSVEQLQDASKDKEDPGGRRSWWKATDAERLLERDTKGRDQLARAIPACPPSRCMLCCCAQVARR